MDGEGEEGLEGTWARCESTDMRGTDVSSQFNGVKRGKIRKLMLQNNEYTHLTSMSLIALAINRTDHLPPRPPSALHQPQSGRG